MNFDEIFATFSKEYLKGDERSFLICLNSITNATHVDILLTFLKQRHLRANPVLIIRVIDWLFENENRLVQLISKPDHFAFIAEHLNEEQCDRLINTMGTWFENNFSASDWNLLLRPLTVAQGLRISQNGKRLENAFSTMTENNLLLDGLSSEQKQFIFATNHLASLKLLAEYAATDRIALPATALSTTDGTDENEEAAYIACITRTLKSENDPQLIRRTVFRLRYLYDNLSESNREAIRVALKVQLANQNKNSLLVLNTFDCRPILTETLGIYRFSTLTPSPGALTRPVLSTASGVPTASGVSTTAGESTTSTETLRLQVGSTTTNGQCAGNITWGFSPQNLIHSNPVVSTLIHLLPQPILDKLNITAISKDEILFLRVKDCKNLDDHKKGVINELISWLKKYQNLLQAAQNNISIQTPHTNSARLTISINHSSSTSDGSAATSNGSNNAELLRLDRIGMMIYLLVYGLHFRCDSWNGLSSIPKIVFGDKWRTINGDNLLIQLNHLSWQFRNFNMATERPETNSNESPPQLPSVFADHERMAKLRKHIQPQGEVNENSNRSSRLYKSRFSSSC